MTSRRSPFGIAGRAPVSDLAGSDLAGPDPRKPDPGGPDRGRRVLLMTLAIAGVTVVFIWNLGFDLWIGQVERQYLWEDARHELNLGPAGWLKAVVAEGR